MLSSEASLELSVLIYNGENRLIYGVFVRWAVIAEVKEGIACLLGLLGMKTPGT